MYLRNFLRRSTLGSLTKFKSRSELQSSYLYSVAALKDKSFSTNPSKDSAASPISQRANIGKFFQNFQENPLGGSEIDDSDSGSDQDAALNEFLSRFVWIMRRNLNEAYPDADKNTIDMMLLVIVEKVVAEIESSGFGQVVGSGATSPPQDFSPDLWQTVWEVSNVVLNDMHRAQKKEKMKVFLQSEEVKELSRFAGEIGIRGDMLRELRFKWAREKMEESEFHENLERLRKEEAEYLAQQQISEGQVKDGEEGVSESAGDIDVAEEKSGVVSLPKRHGKIKYKIYGLDISDEKWAEVANRINDAEEVIGPQEPKPLLGTTKIVTEKILSLEEEDDPSPLLAEWTELHKPSRIDWIALLDKVKEKNSTPYFKIAELLLGEESFQANVRDYGKLVDAYAKQNHLEDAERIIAKMHENGIMPDIPMSSFLVHMHCKAGNLEKAEKEFRNLTEQKFLPDISLYKSMIMAYMHANKPKQAENLMREMETRDMKPGMEIYMGLLRSFASYGDVRGAQRITTTMQFAGFEQNAESFTLLVEAFAKANNLDQARHYFDYMIKLGHKPDDGCTASMIRAYEKNNYLDKASNLLMQLEKDGFEPGVATYTVLVDWLGKLQLVDEVEQLLGKIAELGEAPPFDIHITLCDMYSQAGNKKKALEALRVLEAKKDQLGAEGFERVIRGLLSGGFVQDAERMLGLMESEGFTVPESLKVNIGTSRVISRNRQPDTSTKKM